VNLSAKNNHNDTIVYDLLKSVHIIKNNEYVLLRFLFCFEKNAVENSRLTILITFKSPL